MKRSSELDDWYYVDNWIPTEIINDHIRPSFNKYYGVNFPFYVMLLYF